jgi:phage/conjugal plasmid C-4 type zinc finger TraR family protein
MSDFADLAADREQQLREDALAEHSRRQGKRHVAASAEYCYVCGDPIPEKRRAVVPGVQTCLECQTELEQGLLLAGKGN